MPLKLGTSAVSLKLGSQAVVGYLGSQIVTATVPGKPVIVGFESGNSAQWTAPTSDGGSPITGYKLYIDDVLDLANYGPSDFASVDTVVIGAVLQVSAVNAIGEGPKSDPVTVT